jgi:hypothetical protein
MKITTQRDLIRVVAARWRKAYEPFKHDGPMFSCRVGAVSPPLSKQQIADALDALDGETATPADVAAIIGNASWTRLTCNECGKDVDAILTVGQGPGYESRTASLCMPCVKRAAAMKWPGESDSRNNPPWAGNLHHSRLPYDDWGCLRDENQDLIAMVKPPAYDEDDFIRHRLDDTDPTQARVDAILGAMYGANHQNTNNA